MPIDSGNLALKGLDDLFSTEENRQEEQREQVQQIPIDELHPFTNHPFKVLDDEAMTRTVESIAQYGVLAPLIARPRPDGDGYEIISGHRRQYAAKLAGLDTLPDVIVVARKPERYPALYERLSHDDELQGESNSISNQKRILEDYAEQHGFTNCIHFTDDGISGTQFDRPGFQKMIAEVKADRISVVIIKDMSRFGRDYLQVGTYMEVLRKHDTRLIALNDSVDTLKGDDEFTPFRNIMNEWYARDTSKKIRSAFQAKNLAGKHTSSSVPYGYLKSEQDKNQWVIDPVAAPIVQRIYRMTMEGKGPYQIAAILSAEHIEIPAYYHQKLGIGLWQTREIRDPYKWGSSTIVHILTNPCYLGHTCNFKTRKHFKDKKSHYVDQDQWTIIENTQEPIIDQETYDNVQRIRAGVRRYPDGWGEAHPLGGLLYCADCGSPMYVNRTGNGKRVANFSCSGYGKIPVGSKCSSGHRVNADSVMALIQETLREIVRFSKEDEEEFVRIVKAEAENQQSSEIKGQKTRLAACKKRLDELETLICKIYEDNALGKLPDKRYQILDAQYAKEQESLEAEAASLQKAVDEYESGQKSADKFIALVKKYQNFEKLDTVMLNEFIVCYDIKELGKQMKKLGMLIVQDQVWGRVTANRSSGKSTRYYMDEMHLLLKEEQTAAYSVEIWKRFRKWGGIPTGLTQNVKDLLSSREVENIFENSDMIIMLNQAAGDRQILAKQLNISPHQLSYVTHSGEGEGLLFFGNVILPFVDRFPTDLELYRIMTTKLGEVSEGAQK